jgi:signal transduction histidine kinase
MLNKELGILSESKRFEVLNKKTKDIFDIESKLRVISAAKKIKGAYGTYTKYSDGVVTTDNLIGIGYCNCNDKSIVEKYKEELKKEYLLKIKDIQEQIKKLVNDLEEVKDEMNLDIEKYDEYIKIFDM